MFQCGLQFDYSAPRTSIQWLVVNYLKEVGMLKDDRPYFTDKMPHNFLFVGLIKTVFPNSKIIHCVRDPLDTCFSCYKNDFVGAHYYAYDLESLGRYHLAYQDLMAYWHKILPGSILDVSYEELVDDFEDNAKGIIDFCKLEWSDACLDYHKSKRQVDTLSEDQVMLCL